MCIKQEFRKKFLLVFAAEQTLFYGVKNNLVKSAVLHKIFLCFIHLTKNKINLISLNCLKYIINTEKKWLKHQLKQVRF